MRRWLRKCRSWKNLVGLGLPSRIGPGFSPDIQAQKDVGFSPRDTDCSFEANAAPRRFRTGWTRGPKLAAVPLLAILMLGASDPEARFNRDGHNLMCVCGCAEVLLECNHVGCTDSAREIAELHARLDGSAPGLNGVVPPDRAILDWFAQKYGATVLAAPLRGGFDNVAWIMPFAVFVFGTLGTALLVRFWSQHRRPAAQLASATASPEAQALREKIRQETEYR